MSIIAQLAGMAMSAVIAVSTPYAPPYAPSTVPALAPCATEDSAGPCYWNANERGNGRGRSFIVTDDQRVIYLDSKPAPYELPDYEPNDGDGSQTAEATP